MSEDEWMALVRVYVRVACGVAGLAFLGFWGHAVETYGWFLGLALGWIPALFLGAFVGALWPLVMLAVVGIVLLIYWSPH